MPTKKTTTNKTIEAPEKTPEFVKVTIPLIDPAVGKKLDNRVYVSKTAFEKGMEEYLARNDAYAYIYVSEQEYVSIFGSDPNDNDIKADFLHYAIDGRRRIAEVCGATNDSIILKVPGNDPAMVEFISKSVAVLRFYYDGKSKNNKMELKKGTWIHVIEVSVIGPVQSEETAKTEESDNTIPFADSSDPVVEDANGNVITK
nr:MAG TPA: hypothetical protein [Caudoviricetes sp.]